MSLLAGQRRFRPRAPSGLSGRDGRLEWRAARWHLLQAGGGGADRASGSAGWEEVVWLASWPLAGQPTWGWLSGSAAAGLDRASGRTDPANNRERTCEPPAQLEPHDVSILHPPSSFLRPLAALSWALGRPLGELSRPRVMP